jgi:hypothetical protein
MCLATPFKRAHNMEHDNIVAIEDKKGSWMKIFTSASIDFDMPDVETFMEEVYLSQPMNMQEEVTINDTCLVPWRTLMDIDTVVT